MANDKEQQSNQIDTPPKKSAIRKVGGAVQFTTITIPKKITGLGFDEEQPSIHCQSN
jgi:hypothetical protein